MGQANVKKLFSSYGYLIRRQPVMACPVVIRTGNKRASADVIVAPNHPHARPCTRAETVARARTHGKLRTANKPKSPQKRGAYHKEPMSVHTFLSVPGKKGPFFVQPDGKIPFQ